MRTLALNGVALSADIIRSYGGAFQSVTVLGKNENLLFLFLASMLWYVLLLEEWVLVLVRENVSIGMECTMLSLVELRSASFPSGAEQRRLIVRYESFQMYFWCIYSNWRRTMLPSAVHSQVDWFVLVCLPDGGTIFKVRSHQVKNAVSASIKHSRYFHFWSIRYCSKRLYIHMFDMLDTAFSYGKTLIVC